MHTGIEPAWVELDSAGNERSRITVIRPYTNDDKPRGSRRGVTVNASSNICAWFEATKGTAIPEGASRPLLFSRSRGCWVGLEFDPYCYLYGGVFGTERENVVFAARAYRHTAVPEPNCANAQLASARR